MMYAIWPGGETCSMEEVADFNAMIQFLGDDYYISPVVGFDHDGFPILECEVKHAN